MADKDHFDDRDEKKGSSKQEKSFFGDERTVRYDEYGDRTEISREEKGWFGDRYTQHSDARERETGRTRHEKSLLGDEYEQHYDPRGNKVGRTRREEGMFGDQYDQHYDERGNKTGRTRVNPDSQRREEREERDRESLQQMHKAFSSSGKITFKDLKNVAWGPTFKLAFWRGAAAGFVWGILFILFTPGPILLRLLLGGGVFVGLGLGSWYAAPLMYFLFRGLGLVFGPMTGGIFYAVSSLNLLILGFVMSIGDPIIYYVHRKYPHFFNLDRYSPFLMKTMMFVLKGDGSAADYRASQRHHERAYSPSDDDRQERQQAEEIEEVGAPEAGSIELEGARNFVSDAVPPPERPVQHLSSTSSIPLQSPPTEEVAANDASHTLTRPSRIGAILFALLLVVGAAGGTLYYLTNRPAETAAIVDPEQFVLLPLKVEVELVARESGSNIRALPFARSDITILRESVAGEALNVTGLVNQPDGPWYQIRLDDGRVGFFKESLSMPRSEYRAETPAPDVASASEVAQPAPAPARASVSSAAPVDPCSSLRLVSHEPVPGRGEAFYVQNRSNRYVQFHIYYQGISSIVFTIEPNATSGFGVQSDAMTVCSGVRQLEMSLEQILFNFTIAQSVKHLACAKHP